MFRLLLCKLFGCNLRFVRSLGLYTQHARCRCCGRDYAINYNEGTITPWPTLPKDQHENRTPQR
jgi:hypothetical protein